MTASLHRVLSVAIPPACVVLACAFALPARADFFDDMRRTFQSDIPHFFQDDIPCAFGGQPTSRTRASCRPGERGVRGGVDPGRRTADKEQRTTTR